MLFDKLNVLTEVILIVNIGRFALLNYYYYEEQNYNI